MKHREALSHQPAGGPQSVVRPSEHRLDEWYKPQMDGVMRGLRMLTHLAEAFADMVAERVAARLGSSRTVPPVYTTSTLGPGAPGKSRGWLQRHIQKIPGARLVGRDWEIDVADYNRWFRARLKPRPRTKAPASPDLTALVDECIAEAGLRPTKGTE